MHRFNINRLLYILVVGALLAGCTQTPATSVDTTSQGEASAQENISTDQEVDASHSNDTAPDYATVFPQDAVNRIDITLSPEAWAALQDEMTAQFGEAGTGDNGGGIGQRPQDGQVPNMQPPQGGNMQPPNGANGAFPGNPPGGGKMDFGTTSYVDSTISFNGEAWEHVGFRYSGNSTLQQSWKNGTQKISFRLDFDEYEDTYPETKNQRFYGFKQLSFKSNAMDSSYLREKVTADIFREAGVVSSQTAFYEVYVDYGEGSKYFGVYTVVEIVDDTVIQTQFADDSGNVYKPEGTGAAFVEGTFSETTFEKQTNADEADWSDIQAVFDALHADTRTSDPAAWRAGLEAVFDVDAFIRWLAVDTIIQNWDTYGSMAHNYYLYTDPTDGLVTWIPWDNNMALSASMGGGGDRAGNAGRGGGGMGRGVRDLDITTVGDDWPLINYLMADPTYLAKYQAYLKETIEGVWQPELLAARYQKYHDLIAPYVEKEEAGFTQLQSMQAFDGGLEVLVAHAQARYDAVQAYLAK
jgi:hypothetical protein